MKREMKRERCERVEYTLYQAPISVVLTFQSLDHHVFGIDVVVALFQFLFKTFDHVFAFLGHLNKTQRKKKRSTIALKKQKERTDGTPSVRSDQKKFKQNPTKGKKNQQPNNK